MNSPQRSSVLPTAPSETRRVLRVHCTTHCRSCGSHFSSTTAFDMHRQFEEGHDKDWDHRICVEPADIDRLAPKTTHGYCKLGNPNWPETNATVWAEARGLETNPWRK